MTDVSTALDWAAAGQRRVEGTVARLSPEDMPKPSTLPGWTRGHLITHLARNADALVNLLTWACTGRPTPMYAGPGQRQADIEAGARRPRGMLLEDLRGAGEGFARTANGLSTAAWDARVTSAQGRDIPATEVPRLRVREVWIHLVDLDAGEPIDVIPDDVATYIVHDVAGWMSAMITGAVLLRPDGHRDVILGQEGAEAVGTISGPANLIAGWLTGRSGRERLHCAGEVPALPRWL